jgi:hypothetical protein
LSWKATSPPAGCCSHPGYRCTRLPEIIGESPVQRHLAAHLRHARLGARLGVLGAGVLPTDRLRQPVHHEAVVQAVTGPGWLFPND